MSLDPTTRLGPLDLATPLVAASGTVGSVWEFDRVADVTAYGALTAKSVAGDAWPGRRPPRLAPVGVGMLNGVGIQNPGIGEWVRETAPRLSRVVAPVWGSAVGKTPAEFGRVAAGLTEAGLAAVEVNLSCPNLEDGRMFSLDAGASAEVVEAVRASTSLPVGAKLSPNVVDVAAVAKACWEAGADWVVLTNTAWGAGIDVETRRPLLSGEVGGLSGPPLKHMALRCVMEVRRALPELPILGCGGVVSGTDVVEFLMAGAAAVGLGTVHFAEPRAGRRILDELGAWCQTHAVAAVTDLVGAMEPWEAVTAGSKDD